MADDRLREPRTWSCRHCQFRTEDKRCRANPPTVVVVDTPDGYGGKQSSVEQHWPYMEDYEWCGRWKAFNIITHPHLNP